MPLYPLYALLFADTGLSDAEISVLFALWSAVGIVAEVPSGALADRFPRRSMLAVAAVLQAAGYALWIALPGFWSFAAGFALWGLGGALSSGAQEALLHDGLAAVGAADQYARIQGRVGAAGLVAQIPGAVAATVLFGAGGYDLVGWVSVGTCLVAALVAARLPEAPRPGDTGDGLSYLATLRAGIGEALTRALVRRAVLAYALLFGLDAFEEYFTLVARDATVPTALVPLATLGIPLVGAAGAALGGAANRLGPVGLGLALGAGVLALGAAVQVRHPAALAGVAVFYGLYRMVLVVADARLQARIDGPARATVTSVASTASELSAFAVYGAWAARGAAGVAVLCAAAAVVLPVLLRSGVRKRA